MNNSMINCICHQVTVHHRRCFAGHRWSTVEIKCHEGRLISRAVGLYVLWEVLAQKLQEIFPGNDANGNFVVPALDV